MSAIVGDSAMDPNHLMLLPYSDESTFEEIRNKLTAFLTVIPTTRTKISQTAIDFATQKVPKQKWKTRFRDTERGRLFYILVIQAIFGFVTAIVIFSILGPEEGDQLWSTILAILGSVIASASFVGFFNALSRARKQVRFERENEKILGRPPAGAWRVKFGYAFGSVGTLLNLPVINIVIWMAVWGWLCSLWPDKALSGVFVKERATYEFDSLGNFRKKDGFGEWHGVYIIHGQNVELLERHIPFKFAGRIDRDLTAREDLSVRDVTKRGVTIENRLPEITDDSLRAEFYSDQSKLKDSSEDQASSNLSGKSESKWITFNSPEGRFRVLMPTKPEVEERIDADVGIVHTYSSSNSVAFFMVCYADYPIEASDDTKEAVLDGVRTGVINGTNAEFVSEKKITIGWDSGSNHSAINYPGREFVAKTTIGGSEANSTWRIYLVGRRLYQMVAGPTPDSASAETQRFLSSLQLTN